MSNTPPVSLATPVDSKLASVPEPPDTPPPLEHAYSSQVAGSVSGHSSTRSTPELAIATPYAHQHAALHPSSRVSQSPEMAYAPPPSMHSTTSHWPEQHNQRYHPVKVDTAYGYSEREQPPSPASSAGSQYGAQSQSVSPNTPYSYNHYGAQQASSSQANGHPGKYESSPRKHTSLTVNGS